MSLYTLLEDPRVFGLTQKLNPMTVRVYRRLLHAHVVESRARSVLDIGCGIGAHRPFFPTQRYTGIDINPAYVSMAVNAYDEGFHVMDARRLQFADATFDTAFTIATCHHLDDTTVVSMVREALRVVAPGGAFHIIEPVIPVSPRAVVKRMLFASDRGRHQRTIQQLIDLVTRVGRIRSFDLHAGVLHDVCYIRLTP